jgi:hypothetical protein
MSEQRPASTHRLDELGDPMRAELIKLINTAASYAWLNDDVSAGQLATLRAQFDEAMRARADQFDEAMRALVRGQQT